MPRSCTLIAKALEKYAHEVKSQEREPVSEPDFEFDFAKVNCIIDAYPPPWVSASRSESQFASLYFKGGRLHDGDVIISKPQRVVVKELLKTTARSCRLVEIHTHVAEGEEEQYHFHLKGCNIPDLGKVLEAGGYKG